MGAAASAPTVVRLTVPALAAAQHAKRYSLIGLPIYRCTVGPNWEEALFIN